MWAVIAELAGTGVTVFLTTQYLEDADQLADRVAVLDGGRLVADGTPDELKTRVAAQRLDLILADRAAFEDVAARLGERLVSSDPGRLTIAAPTDGTAAHVRAILDEVDPGRRGVQRFAVHSATLDDVFLTLTGHAAGPSSTPSRPAKEASHV